MKTIKNNMKLSKLSASMLLAFAANYSHADLVPVDNKQILGIDCSSQICLDSLTPQNMIFWGSTYKRAFDANGKCYEIKPDKMVYTKNKYAAANMSVNSMISESQLCNPNQYDSGLDSCEEIGDGLVCYTNLTQKSIDENGNEIWVTKTRAGNFSIGVWHYPSPVANICGSGLTYINGLGCVGNGGGDYPVSDRTTSAVQSSCKTGTCDDPMLGKVNNNPTASGIDLMTASKVEQKTDMVSPFRFTRNYVSKRNSSGSLGNNWRHNFEKFVQVNTSYTQDNTPYVGSVIFKEENDEEIVFSRLAPTDSFTPVFKDQKEFKLEISGSNYILKAPNGNKEIYSNAGKLTKITYPGGYSLDLVYVGNNLTQITDSYNHSMNFTYNNGLLSNITTEQGDSIDYTYEDGNLASQSLNGGRTISYGYQGNKLTTISNAAGQNLTTINYDSNGKAIETKNNSGSGYINVQNISYTTSAATVSKPNAGEIFNKTRANLKTVPTQVVFSSTGSPNFTASNVSVDSNNALPTGYTDADGNNYTYTYDSDGWLASTTKNGIKTTFTWDKANNLLTSTTKTTTAGTVTTNYTYNSDKLLTQKSVVTSNSGTRNWSYTYGTFGKLLTQTEPNGAVTTYTYYSDTDNDISKRGKLNTVSNAVGHTITVNSYDNRGNPTSITMPNGLVKTYSYNDLGQVLLENVGSLTTSYSYDVNGLLTQAQLPSGYIINFTYDQAGRRTGISDNQGGSITYTLDSVTNLPTNMSAYKNSTLQVAANQVVDGLGRLKEAWNNNSAEKYTYSYSSSGYSTGFKVGYETNPRSETQNNSYNKSLLSYQSGYGKTTNITYDQDDNPTTIQANNINYNMTYNQFSELLTSNNVNSGLDSYAYDITNNKITKTDAANIVTVNQFDSIGRIVNIDAGGDQKVFTYDTVQTGKLTSATNGNTTVSYIYNSLGLPTSKTQVVGSDTKTISYGYDNAGQLSTVTYPSGLVVTYTRNNGVVTGISYGGGNIISNVDSQAMTFNPLSWTWGNGLTRAKAYDTSGKITSLNDGLLSQTYNLDGLFNVLTINDSGTTKNYEYQNAASPVTKYYTNLGQIRYGFDSKNQRTFSVDSFASKTYNFNYTYGTNKLSQWDNGSNWYNYSYDAKGNVTNNGKGTFSYNNQNNLASATITGNTFNYTYNAFDERVGKVGTNVNRTYLYNENHQLIGEYENGTAVAEYIYFGEIPVAVYQNNQMYFVHTDHLNTPRAITNSSQALVWKWENVDPFGKNAPVNSGIDFNLRYSGQYFDNESGLHYNYYRYYNPETGRYMQVDPIGIKGGYDVYGYVNQNPFKVF